jgi:hypothetical protein
MAENRLNRELETREKTVRKTAWTRPEVLPSPPSRAGLRISLDSYKYSRENSVDNNLMRENDPRMPLFNERKTNVTFGKGA